MEAEVQKLAITALVGLLLLFPVFNQVQATSLDALRDADHQAKFKDLIKDWDDIPEDEKLSYWDGRNKPPGSGDFDRDRVDDDARIRDPGPGEPKDSDGDGVPDSEDPYPDDPKANDQVKKVWHTVVLWTFTGPDDGRADTEALTGPPGVTTYDYVNVTFDYSGFTGRANFILRASGAELWSEELGNGELYAFSETDQGNSSDQEVPADNLQIEYDYQPLAAPDGFDIEITGAYVEYVPVEYTGDQDE